MKTGDKVQINGHQYEYEGPWEDYHKGGHWVNNDPGVVPGVICECGNTEFTIYSHQDYNTSAKCKCGNVFTVHDG